MPLYALGDAPQKDLEGTLRQVAAISYCDIEQPGPDGPRAGLIFAAPPTRSDLATRELSIHLETPTSKKA